LEQSGDRTIPVTAQEPVQGGCIVHAFGTRSHYCVPENELDIDAPPPPPIVEIAEGRARRLRIAPELRVPDLGSQA